REHVLVSQLAGMLNVGSDELADRVGATIARVKELEKELERLRGAAVMASASDLAFTATDENGVAVVSHRVPDGAAADDLRKLALDVRGRLDAAQPAVVAVASVSDGRP